MSRFFPLTALQISFLVTLLVILLFFWTAQSVFMRNLEAKALDLRFHWRGVTSPGPQIIVVLIDDKSIAALGRWPWSRTRFAEMVHRLKTAGAKVIALDLLFTEPEVTSARAVLHQVRTLFESLPLPAPDATLKVFHQTLRELEEGGEPDQQFANALQHAGNVVLPFSFEVVTPTSPASPAGDSPPDFILRFAYRTMQNLGPEPPLSPFTAVNILSPLAQLGQQAASLAHVNVAFDSDGTPRYDYPVVEYQGKYYPSFALQVARLYRGFMVEEITIRFGEGIQFGDIFIPTDESMRMLVNYYGPRDTFPSVSFADVLQGNFPDSLFQDKIVLIGGAAVGVGDTFVTPFSPALPGVERHANIIDTILQANFLIRRDSTRLIDLFCILILGLLAGWLSARCPSFWGNLFALVVGVLFVLLNILAFTWAGWWVNLLFPLLVILLNQSAITLYKFLTEERQKRMIRRAFQYYLHPAVVDQVAQNPQLLTLRGEEQELTVLFSDIRSFSTLSERLTPQELVLLLNEYLTPMTQCVLEENGLLDKYIGDAIMAVYGAPLPLPDHAYRACHTALNMMTTLRTLQKQWTERGLPLINIGIGINTGRMVVGNMGAALHFNYTVIGDEVNLASRLEGVNKEYGTHIIISESTWMQVHDRIATREIDLIRVKGKEHPTRIFEVLGFLPLPSSQLVPMQLFAEGIQAYRAQQWNQAIQHFTQVIQYRPNDRPSQLYIQRCKEFQITPPPSEWDGVYLMKTK